jgi:hypothetical protein
MMFIDDLEIPPLPNALLSANCFGLYAETKDRRKAHLAIVDERGNVLEMGDHVEQAAWGLMLKARNNFLMGLGHLKVFGPCAPTRHRIINKDFFMLMKRPRREAN